MEVIDCKWEYNNIGKKTVEITIDSNEDLYEDNIIKKLYEFYDYVVFKIPMMRTDYNYLFSKLGFVMIEVQMNVEMCPASFNYKMILDYCQSVSFKHIDKNAVDTVCAHITPDMFSTDRISLDEKFGPSVGMRRYKNWIMSELQNGTSQLVTVFYKDKEVGFMLYRIENGVFYLLLNGLYKEWQGKGLGIITPASPLLFLKSSNTFVDKIDTHISSNNIPVVKLYNRLGYRFSSMKYVFVKHIN